MRTTEKADQNPQKVIENPRKAVRETVFFAQNRGFSIYRKENKVSQIFSISENGYKGVNISNKMN